MKPKFTFQNANGSSLITFYGEYIDDNKNIRLKNISQPEFFGFNVIINEKEKCIEVRAYEHSKDLISLKLTQQHQEALAECISFKKAVLKDVTLISEAIIKGEEPILAIEGDKTLIMAPAILSGYNKSIKYLRAYEYAVMSIAKSIGKPLEFKSSEQLQEILRTAYKKALENGTSFELIENDNGIRGNKVTIQQLLEFV